MCARDWQRDSSAHLATSRPKSGRRNRESDACYLEWNQTGARSAVASGELDERMPLLLDGIIWSRIMIFIISEEYALNNRPDSKFPNLHLVNMTIHVQILTFNVDHQTILRTSIRVTGMLPSLCPHIWSAIFGLKSFGSK